MAIAAPHLAASSKLACPPTSVASSRPRAAHLSLASPAFSPLSSRAPSSKIRISNRNVAGLARVPLLRPVRAAASEEAGQDFVKQAEEVYKELKAKWDGVGSKTSVAIYASGALAVLWFSSTVVTTINNVPLLPNLMELVGLGYSAWFVYRYLLFQENRKELAGELKELKRKITGVADDISS